MDDKKKRKAEDLDDVILGNEATLESDENVIASEAKYRPVPGEVKQSQEEMNEPDPVQIAEAKYKRALADYQNLQRRVQEEKGEWIRTSNKNLVLKLLPILDTLMLAEKHTKDKTFSLLVQQFLQILQEEGVRRIKTLGEKFDPNTMEAIETREGNEGEVLEEAAAGYELYGQVLRPAKVVVGSGKN